MTKIIEHLTATSSVRAPTELRSSLSSGIEQATSGGIALMGKSSSPYVEFPSENGKVDNERRRFWERLGRRAARSRRAC